MSNSSELPSQFTQIVLNERPKAGPITPTTFNTVQKSINDLQSSLKEKGKGKENHVLIQVDYVSLDPAMRGWLSDRRSYVEPVQIGDVMRAGGIGTVVDVGSQVQSVQVGDVVECMAGWTEYVLLHEKQVKKLEVPPGAIDLDYLGNLGNPGLTAYFGLFEIGKLKAGETLVVSGAAGAVGSMVCQLGKIVGAKVYAIAGSDDKCEWLEKDIGVDKALNYKSSTFVEDFKKSVGYLDVYFDNVGGDILDLCLTRLNKFARIAFCGAISGYNDPNPKYLKNYVNLISQHASLSGFITFNYANRYPEARAKIGQWLGEGKLKRRFYIQNGLEKAPQYLEELYQGKNTGKMVVKVSSKPTPKL